MTEQPTREPFRPRVWWSPTQGVIEQVEPRWPDEPMRCVRTRDRYVVPVPDDAVELHTEGVTVEQVAYIKAATLQEEANWWEQVRPTTVGRTQFGTWLRGRAEVHLRAAGITVQDGEQHG